MRRRLTGWLIAIALLTLLGTLVVVQQRRNGVELQIQPGVPGDEISCAALQAERPLVVLVMGQSNAGNHGGFDPAIAAAKPIRVLHEGRCYFSHAPLPGATGSGASLWPLLEQELAGRAGPAWLQRPRVYAVIAVESTRIEVWSSDDTSVNRAWRAQLGKLRAAGWQPALVLWQHGEADAKAGTGAAAYVDALLKFSAAVREAGGGAAPWVAARSAYCDGADRTEMHQAWQTLSSQPGGYLPGPDTDSLLGPDRRDPCHFSADGLRHAARLWADALLPLPLAAPQ